MAPLPTPDVHYRPLGAARALFHFRGPEVLLSGPAGTGKSLACLWKLHYCCSNVPGLRCLAVRKTRVSLAESGLVTFEAKVLPKGHPALSGPSRHNRQSYTYPNGSEIAVGGLDKSSKIMSTEFDLIYVQEAIELEEGDWDDLSTRLRHGVLPFQQQLADTNPAQPDHWLKRRCDAGRCLMLHSRHEDNPTVTPEYLARLDALTGARRERLRYGRWVKAEGVVYPGWDARTHLIDPFPIPRSWPRYWSLDFGLVNPFVCGFWATDPDGRLYLYREVYHTGRLVEDHARRCLQLCGAEKGNWPYGGEPRPRAVVADHDAEGRETFERHTGLKTVEANKAIREGIQDVSARLRVQKDGRPRLFILRGALDERDPELSESHRPCSTAEEWDGYCFVAGTMVRAESGEVPIEDVRPGDLVWTREGLLPVERAGMTQRAAVVWTARFSNGTSLTGTGDHPVYSQERGWVSLSSLSSEDTMEVWIPQPFFSMGSSTEDIPRPEIGQRETTSEPHHPTASEAEATSTLTCGSPFTEKSPKGTTFTTETATRSTTPSTTSNASPRPSMLMHTGGILCGVPPNGWPNSMPPGSCPQSGPERQKAERLPVCDASGNGRPESLPSEPVSSATASSSAATPASPDSARGPAMRRGERASEVTTRTESAPFAPRISVPTSGSERPAVPVRVLSISAERELAPVYNLTVDEVPEYFANGLLVHNCWDTRQNRKHGEEPVDRDNHGMDQVRYMVRHLDAKARGGKVEAPTEDNRTAADMLPEGVLENWGERGNY